MIGGGEESRLEVFVFIVDSFGSEDELSPKSLFL